MTRPSSRQAYHRLLAETLAGDLRAWDVDLDGVPDFYVDAGSYGYYPSFFIGGHPSGGLDNGFIANLKYQSYFMASYPFATNLESDAQVGGALTNFLPSAHLASSFSTLGGVYQGGDFLYLPRVSLSDR